MRQKSNINVSGGHGVGQVFQVLISEVEIRLTQSVK